MTQNLFRALALFLIFLLPVLSLSAQDEIPFFEEAPCFFPVIEPEIDGETIRCGYLFVPENRTSADSPEIELAVAILSSVGINPQPDPIIYLEGGPGGSAIASVDAWFASALREDRDIILIDQRGTGYSFPSLNCYELDEGDEGATEACRERLIEEGVDLDAYNSAENAADIADLVRALELEEVNLFGVSYGTRLALTVLRDHPQVIRTVMIDAVYPPHVQGYNEQPQWGDRAFQILFERCAADDACAEAFPDLDQVFYDTVDALNDEPALFQDPESGDERELTGEDMVNELYQLLYDSAAIPYLPLQIYAASEGDFETYLYPPYEDSGEGGADEGAVGLTDEQYNTLLMNFLGMESEEELEEYLAELSDEELAELEEEALGGIDSDSEGMFNSVECAEELPFNDLDAAAEAAEGLPPQIGEAMLTGVEQQFVDCETWNVQPADPLENEPVVSDLPVLVLSGEFDPITPPEWGQAAAEYLSSSFFYTFPGMGHGAVDVDPCPTQIALDFLANPLAEPDSGCIAEMQVSFYTP